MRVRSKDQAAAEQAEAGDQKTFQGRHKEDGESKDTRGEEMISHPLKAR